MLITVTSNRLIPHKSPCLGPFRNTNLIKLLDQSITLFKITESFYTITSVAKENFRASFRINPKSRNIGWSRSSLIGKTTMGERAEEKSFMLMITPISKKYYSFHSKKRLNIANLWPICRKKVPLMYETLSYERSNINNSHKSCITQSI